MNHRSTLSTLFTTLLAALLPSVGAHAAPSEGAIDLQNDEMDVTLFRGAANNSYFAVYFNAEPTPGAETVEVETRAINLRPERDVTLHVEIYNPNGTLPLIVTPGGNGDTRGFGGFARNVAAAAPEVKVIIYDRRNLGLSEVTFGSEPQMIEEGEDLHVLIERLGVAPVALYGMSSGARSNLILASRYPEDVAALVIAPLTGGPLAATRLSEEYFLKYLHDENLTTMKHISATPITTMAALAETPLWSAYLARNTAAKQRRFLEADIDDFLAAMKTSAEHLRASWHQTALGIQDEALAALEIPATLILHHGSYTDPIHPLTHTRAATTLIPNSSFAVAPHLPDVLGALLPFLRRHAPTLSQ